jgi:hypothetical protein
MALEPLKIPQNVYIEDRIVGPITLRQIIVMGIGGGISYVTWGIFAQANGGSTPLPVTIIACIPFVISAAFAFVKVNDLSLLRIGFLMLERMNKPQVRAFTPRTGFSIHIRTFTEPARLRQPLSPEKMQSQQRMDDLTAILDTPMRRQAQASAPFAEPRAGDEEELSVRDANASVETHEAEAPSSLSRLPVNRERIKASPMPEGEDGTKASVSIFRDIVAK